jgi:hypothetical protein
VSPPPTASSAGAAGIDADLERFAAAVREDEARRRAEAQHRADAVEHARRLDEARAVLDRAIADVRRAKEMGKGRAAADEAWKVAKATVIELESGAPPSWAKQVAAADGLTVDGLAADGLAAGAVESDVSGDDATGDGTHG